MGRFRPRLEALEDRSVPAVVGPIVSPTDPGTIFFIGTNPTGTTTNTLNIFDNGAGGIKFNTTTTTGTQTALPKTAAAQIHRIIYFASSGTDRLNYIVPKTTALSEHMEVDVLLPVSGEIGFTGTFGVFAIPFNPNTGGPGVAPNMAVPSVPVNIAGELDIKIFGNVRRDNVTMNYDGRVNGILNALFLDPQSPHLPHAHGQDGDKVSFNFMLEAFSSGVVRPRIHGGVGDDAFTLFVRKLRPKDHVHILQSHAVTGGGATLLQQAQGAGGMNTATLGQGATGINV
jgi:hypothetical protein